MKQISQHWIELEKVVRELLQEYVPPTLVLGKSTIYNLGLPTAAQLHDFLQRGRPYRSRQSITRPSDPLKEQHIDPTRISMYKPAMVEYLASYGLQLQNPSLVPVAVLEAVANYVDGRRVR